MMIARVSQSCARAIIRKMKAIRYSWFVFFNCCCIIWFNSKPGEMGLQKFIIKLVANIELDIVFLCVSMLSSH